MRPRCSTPAPAPSTSPRWKPLRSDVGSFASLGNGSPQEGAGLRTTIAATAGATLSFDWRFTTSDYLPFNDFAAVVLGSAVTELSDVAALGNTVGNTTSTGGRPPRSPSRTAAN
ncbi:MAG: hypothetical protein HPM95_07440 [Alphaproteobacteria bacterium]|nr:hypothetical protein [Alphaproteobacteria bacterium]